MLLELRINNLVLAEDVVIRLGPNLTVLTGETGAGKSLVAGALALLAGGKADRELIRTDEEMAWVEAVCDVSDRPDLREYLRHLGLVVGTDGVLLLRRELRREGRGRVIIDGRQSSLSVLENVGARLFAIQSQDQKRELSATGFARELLDDVLGLQSLREDVAAALVRFNHASETLATRNQETTLAAQQLDMWRYQRDEIAGAGLREGEEEELAEAIEIKRHAQALLEAAAAAREQLDTGGTSARSTLGAAMAALQAHSERSPRLADAHNSLVAATDLIADASAQLERFLDGFADDPRDLDELQARKACYEELRRKYRTDVVGLLALGEELERQLARHRDSDDELDNLREALEVARGELAAACEQLHAARSTGAAKVAAAARTTIRPLALPELDVTIEVTPAFDPDGAVCIRDQRCRVAAHGCDLVSLQVCTNPGERPGEVASVASGGEAARIHLGLTVLRQGRQAPLVWLFDEVDAGLGMDAASPVALMLRELANAGQALCITHLPTVAVHGAQHWLVEKRVRDGRTGLVLRELDAAARVDEIARQLGGEGWRQGDAAAQTAYARELLAAAGRAATRSAAS